MMLQSLPVDFLKNLEDLDEEVDDVEVQLDRCHDVLLSTQSGHNHLGNIHIYYNIITTILIKDGRKYLSVKDDEEGEEESSTNCHCCLG